MRDIIKKIIEGVIEDKNTLQIFIIWLALGGTVCFVSLCILIANII